MSNDPPSLEWVIETLLAIEALPEPERETMKQKAADNNNVGIGHLKAATAIFLRRHLQ